MSLNAENILSISSFNTFDFVICHWIFKCVFDNWIEKVFVFFLTFCLVIIIRTGSISVNLILR